MTESVNEEQIEALTPHPRYPGCPDLDVLKAGSPNGSWREYRRNLRPNYGQVWRDIAFYYCAIIAGLAVPWVCERGLPNFWRWFLVLPTAVWTGYWLHALLCYIHEAVHFLVHPNKYWNDKLADWFVCSFLAQSVPRYRLVHWQHHLHLGEEGDSEISYRRALTLRFIIYAFTGINLIEALLRRRNVANKQQAPSSAKEPSSLMPLIRFGAIQVIVVGLCVWFGKWEIALGWLIGVFSICPALVSIQAILEHRDENATADDLTQRGMSTNRMFGTNFLARHFGAAGFNRHMIHHWDPQISYTRFDEMEAFLMQTPAGARAGSSFSFVPHSLPLNRSSFIGQSPCRRGRVRVPGRAPARAIARSSGLFAQAPWRSCVLFLRAAFQAAATRSGRPGVNSAFAQKRLCKPCCGSK